MRLHDGLPDERTDDGIEQCLPFQGALRRIGLELERLRLQFDAAHRHRIVLEGRREGLSALGRSRGGRRVAGVAYGNTAAFAEAVRSHMDGGFHQTNGGDFAATANWTVAGATGYYAPVLVTPSGQIFVVGTANADGHEHIRIYGENTFGFEDLAANQGSDSDYNDMVMRLHPTQHDV